MMIQRNQTTTTKSFNLSKSRNEWLKHLSGKDPSPFLKDASPSFRGPLLAHLASFEPDWIVFSELKSDMGASPLVYIAGNGVIVPLGCKHCLIGSRSYDGQRLTIAAKQAVPFSQRSTALDDFSFLFDRILFFCPYCNRLIKDYAGDFIA